MAQYVAIKLGRRAVAFDPAPLAASLMEALKEEASAGGSLAVTGTVKLPIYQNITNYRGSNDLLTSAAASLIVGNAAITVQNTASVPRWVEAIDLAYRDTSSVRLNHSMDYLAVAMKAVQLAAPSITASAP